MCSLEIPWNAIHSDDDVPVLFFESASDAYTETVLVEGIRGGDDRLIALRNGPGDVPHIAIELAMTFDALASYEVDTPGGHREFAVPLGLIRQRGTFRRRRARLVPPWEVMEGTDEKSTHTAPTNASNDTNDARGAIPWQALDEVDGRIVLYLAVNGVDASNVISTGFPELPAPRRRGRRQQGNRPPRPHGVRLASVPRVLAPEDDGWLAVSLPREIVERHEDTDTSAYREFCFPAAILRDAQLRFIPRGGRVPYVEDICDVIAALER